MHAWHTGSLVGPYELVSEVGAGGMGEVWKARDTRLGRVVAIKRLHVEHTAAFQREARTIAALNHPNICTLHDIGADYLVMEYVDGVRLQGPLTVPDALRLADQIATALAAAHDRGIIHCDLKPANILVTDGRAKLLDFGVARLRAKPGADNTVTGDGAVAGTPAYMAPEQAQGKPPDERSDIFSFGAVLYEILSGRRAFEGGSTADVLTAVLRDQPPALPVPDTVARLVTRCLDKVPGQRFQTMADVRAALRQLSAAPDGQPPSIAVLPFANMSSDPEQEYFSDGLTEEIINALVQVPGLKVIARTSAFAFKGQHTDIRRIAEALGVNHILEGSVRKGGTRIRVTAQLIKVEDGCHLWSERYDRELADVFAVQDEIATAISGALQGRLAIAAPRARVHPPGVAAYEAFLMARYHQWKLMPDSLDQARAGLERAIALDPGYALAYAARAEHYFIRTGSSMMPPAEGFDLIRTAARRALEIDPTLPEAHAWLGVAATTGDFDWAEGEKHFRHAMDQQPGSSRVRHLYGYFYLRLIGRPAEAVRLHREALEDDPLNLIMRVGLAASLTDAGHYAEASREAHRIVEIDPNFSATYSLLALDPEREPLPVALANAERGHQLAPWSHSNQGLLAGLLARNGDRDRSDALLQQLRESHGHGTPLGLALYYLASHDVERGIEWVETAIDQRHPAAMMILVCGPYSAMLRASPRWPAVARRVHL